MTCRTRLQIALTLASVIAGCAALFSFYPPGILSQSEAALRPPFSLSGGNLFVATVDLPASAMWNRSRLPDLSVFENGRKLGALDLERISEGSGRQIVFRPSDGSDPNLNGRTYMVRFARAAVPLPLSLFAAVAGATAAFALLALCIEALFGRRTALGRFTLAAASLLYTGALLEGLSAVLLSDRLAGSSVVRNMYNQALHPESVPVQVAGSANFVGHPYLNFVLNPGTTSSSRGQIDPIHRIRRTEALRPRREVAWRALVLGGSTAFGELIAREQDTWVYRLEQKIRAAHGPSYDVVNGGVSGYNVVDNFIHYILLLDELEPDVVVLYVGINDVHVRLSGDIVPDYSNNRLRWRGEQNTPPAPDPRLLWSSTYRYLLLREIERRRFAHIYQFVQRPYPPATEWAAALGRNGPEIYREHLRALARLIVAQGRKVVIVPQAFVPKSADNPFARGVAEHNAVNEAVARELSLPVVAEVPAAFRRGDLFDDMHFNVRGSEKMAELLFAFFEREWTEQGARGAARAAGA